MSSAVLVLHKGFLKKYSMSSNTTLLLLSTREYLITKVHDTYLDKAFLRVKGKLIQFKMTIKLKVVKYFHPNSCVIRAVKPRFL